MLSGESPPSSAGPRGSLLLGVHAAALTLALDRAAVRVVDALAARDLPSILLKGPAIARWLYPGEFRPYGDIDLLVRVDSLPAVTEVLSQCGFAPVDLAPDHFQASDHAISFVDAAGITIDLHQRLASTPAEPAVVWQALAEGTVQLDVAGGTVTALDVVGQFLVIALHAAQHGQREPGPIEDLRRALLVTPVSAVRRARDLADALGASESFSAAGVLDPDLGALLSQDADAPVGDVFLRARLASLVSEPGVFVLLTLLRGPWRRKWLVLRRTVWPSRQLLHQRMPGADGTSRVRLLAGWYGYQLGHLPVAVRQLRALRRRTGER